MIFKVRSRNKWNTHGLTYCVVSSVQIRSYLSRLWIGFKYIAIASIRWLIIQTLGLIDLQPKPPVRYNGGNLKRLCLNIQEYAEFEYKIWYYLYNEVNYGLGKSTLTWNGANKLVFPLSGGPTTINFGIFFGNFLWRNNW